MTRNQTILALLATAVVAWGCGRAPNGQSASLSPTASKSLEARVAKLEQELKAAQVQAADAETRLRAELARGQAIEKERNDLRASLKVRTTERDNVQAQFDGFRKSLKDLLGQMEATAAAPQHNPGSLPTVSAPPIPTSVNAVSPPKGF